MEHKANKINRIKYYIEPKSFPAQTAIVLMALSAVFRIFGGIGFFNDQVFLLTQMLLPICCNLLFILCIILLAKKAFFLSAIPVLLGVVFFIIKSFSFSSMVHTVLCILLYLLVAVIYTGTVVGSVETKWLLPPLFGLPFIYHLAVEDIPALLNSQTPVTFSDGLMEMSVLCIMAALFFTGIGLKKLIPPEESEPALPQDISTAITVPDPTEEAITPASKMEQEDTVSYDAVPCSEEAPFDVTENSDSDSAVQENQA